MCIFDASIYVKQHCRIVQLLVFIFASNLSLFEFLYVLDAYKNINGRYNADTRWCYPLHIYILQIISTYNLVVL
jgi:hypothetical protein